MDDVHLYVAMLFYRFFLKKKKSFFETESHISTIEEKLAAMGPALDHFQKLHITNARFSGRKCHRTDDQQEEIMILNWSIVSNHHHIQRKIIEGTI